MNAKERVKNLAVGQRGETTTGTDSGSDTDGEAGTDTEESDVEPLPLDAVFELLKNQRRRYTIDYLREADGEVTLSDLAEHVAALENDTTIQALSSDERKRAYVGLYQCHLPKMNEMAAVEFNRDRGIIEIGPNAAQLEPYLDLDEEAEPRNWPAYYLALSGAGLLMLAVSLLATTGPVFVSLTCVGTVFAFAALAVTHYRTDGPEDG